MISPRYGLTITDPATGISASGSPRFDHYRVARSVAATKRAQLKQLGLIVTIYDRNKS